MLPRVTILLFIELMAGFFLRQYRVAMEEYRYFERNHRTKERIYASYLIRRERGTEKDLIELANRLLDDTSEVLKEGETTPILEAQRPLLS